MESIAGSKDPTRHEPHADTADPERPKLRNGNEDSKWQKSIAEELDPNRPAPLANNNESERDEVRTNNDDPMSTISKVEGDESNLV